MVELLALSLVALAVAVAFSTRGARPKDPITPRQVALRGASAFLLGSAAALFHDPSRPFDGFVHLVAATMAIGTAHCVLVPYLTSDRLGADVSVDR